jgi:hypothetical protein
METIVNCQTAKKSFAQTSKAFILSLIAQRRRLLFIGESKIEKDNAYDAIKIIDRLLDAYEFASDESMARLVHNHYNTIAQILPGKGSACHKSRLKALMNIYNQAIIINTSKSMKEFTFYRVTNDNGEEFIKTNLIKCHVLKITYSGKIDVKEFDTNYKRFNGDVIVEITQEQFKEGARRIANQLMRNLGL